MNSLQLKPIGIIHSPFHQPLGTPIQPSSPPGREGSIILFPEFAGGLKDLTGFDRIWLLYWFHQTVESPLLVRPFLDSAEHGVFTTRAPCRPNPIGLSNLRLLSIHGTTLEVAEIDIIDGTPLLDIKPYIPDFDNYSISRCGWFDRNRLNSAKSTIADGRFEKGGDK